MFAKVKDLLFRHQGKITLNSGRVIYIHASNIKTTRDPQSGDIIGLHADDCRDFPLYIRLHDISAIQTRRVFR